MPCPFSSGPSDADGRRPRDLGRFFRRDVLKGALAVGGSAALAACVDETGSSEVARGVETVEAVPERQFAWNDYLSRDQHANTIFPYHQLVLLLSYAAGGTPTADERGAVADAFATLDRAYQRGNGGADPYTPEAFATPGVLYTMGYSTRYFDRFDESLPEDIGLTSAEALLEAVDEDPANADPYDAALVLTSDYAQVLLSIELALFGELSTLNGVAVEGTFEGVFELAERRTGFVGPGVPRRELDREEIHSRAPLSMGFVSGFADNQASEDRVAIGSGPFADGSIQQLSRLTLDLDAWYDLSKPDRVELMFSPDHTVEDVGEVGEFLAADSGLTREMDERMPDHAREEGRVGHTQKLAASRDEDFEPLILRRSEAVSTDDPHPGFNFTSLQRDVEDFVAVRRAMDGDHLDVKVDDDQNGILAYHTVESRGAYLVPPRSKIALPTPRPEDRP